MVKPGGMFRASRAYTYNHFFGTLTLTEETHGGAIGFITQGLTVNLPTLTPTLQGLQFVLINVDPASAGGNVTITPDAGANINGGVAGASVSLPPNEAVTCVASAAGWFAIVV